MEGRRGSVALIIALVIVVILAVAGGLWYWTAHKPGANSPQTQNTAAASTSTTYQNADYGVSFDYPNTWTVKSGDTAEGDYGLNTKYDPNATSLITVEMPTDSYPGSGFGGAYFNLSVDKQMGQSQCSSLASRLSQNIKTTTIGGVAFNWFDEGSAAAGTSEYTESYIGYTNGTCFEFNLGDAGGSNVNAVTGVPGPSYAGDIPALEGLLPSVHFTGTSAVGTPTIQNTNSVTTTTTAFVATTGTPSIQSPTQPINASTASNSSIATSASWSYGRFSFTAPITGCFAFKYPPTFSAPVGDSVSDNNGNTFDYTVDLSQNINFQQVEGFYEGEGYTEKDFTTVGGLAGKEFFLENRDTLFDIFVTGSQQIMIGLDFYHDPRVPSSPLALSTEEAIAQSIVFPCPSK